MLTLFCPSDDNPTEREWAGEGRPVLAHQGWQEAGDGQQGLSQIHVRGGN